MPITRYGDISPRTAGFAAVRLLERAKPLMVLERYGQMDPQGKNKTKTRKWRRYEPFAAATAPLAEGITPEAQVMTYTDVTATLEQYGAYVIITDVIADTHEDPVLQENIDLCGEQAAETVELIRMAVVKGGSNVFRAGSATSRAGVNSTVAKGELQQIKRTLKRAKCQEITQIISATAKISTEPVGAAYIALAHTDLDSDIRKVTGFVPIEQYASSEKAHPGEIGKIENIRFVLTTLVTPWLASGTSGTTYLSNGATVTASAACDVYPILIFGKNAFGIVPLAGQNSITPMVVNPKPAASDPLGQRGSVGWKTMQAAAILQTSFLVRYEVACTASPS